MAWVRWGDTAANHPVVVKVYEHEQLDDRLVNEVNGFVSRCAQQAGAHFTDYVVSRGTAVLIAGPSRVDFLLEVAIFAGYMTVDHDDDGKKVYKLIDTDHDFLHLRLREEVEWEKQRRADNSNPALIVPVRLRDGDACRWCGRVVNWSARTGGLNGTYDHLVAGRGANAETLLVCCGSCNSARGNGHPDFENRNPLPPPVNPYFSRITADWFRDNPKIQRFADDNGYDIPSRPRKVIKPGNPAPNAEADSTPENPAQPQSSEPAGDRTGTQPVNEGNAHPSTTPAAHLDTTSTSAPSKQRPDTQSESAPETGDDQRTNPVLRNPQDSAGREPAFPDGTGRVGTGRDGSGRVGSPALADPPPASREPGADPPRRRRSRRSRRPRSQSSINRGGNQ